MTDPSLRYVVCVRGDVNVDLEPLKVYRVVPDQKSQTRGFLRVVDASGEDYLYPARFFRAIVAGKDLFKIVQAENPEL